MCVVSADGAAAGAGGRACGRAGAEPHDIIRGDMLCVASADGAAAGAGGRAVGGRGEAGAAAACVAGRVSLAAQGAWAWGGGSVRDNVLLGAAAAPARGTHACCPRAACAGTCSASRAGTSRRWGSAAQRSAADSARASASPGTPHHLSQPPTHRH